MTASKHNGQCLSRISACVNAVKVGQKDDTLLFIRVSAGDDGDGGFCLAGVVGQGRHVGGDVEKFARAQSGVVFQLISIPHAADAAEHVNGGFVRGVFVRLGAAPGRKVDQLHVDALGTDGFRRNRRGVHEALFALEGCSPADNMAGGSFSHGCHVTDLN